MANQVIELNKEEENVFEIFKLPLRILSKINEFRRKDIYRRF